MLFVFLWSTGFIGAKFGLPAAEPFTMLGIRMGIACLLLLILMPFFNVRWPKAVADYGNLILVGVLVHGIYLGGVFFAIYRGVDAGISAIIVGLQPLLTAAIAVSWLNESLTRLKSLGLLTGFVGIFIVISQQGIGVDGINSAGILACVISLVAISIGTIYQKRFCTHCDLLPSVFIQYIGAGMLFLWLSFWLENQDIFWSLRFSLTLAWLVIVLSIGAVVLLMWLIRVGEASKIASLFYLVPPMVAIEAWILFGETMSLFSIAGVGLCVTGVLLVLKSPSVGRS